MGRVRELRQPVRLPNLSDSSSSVKCFECCASGSGAARPVLAVTGDGGNDLRVVASTVRSTEFRILIGMR